MGLEIYRKKRDFAVTPEPRGTTQPPAGGRYVIQKHDASRLHYDLRLELDGVMKSWAVAKGPSLVAGEKRLAIHVEDHPVAYNTFEGTIPQGQYGGGTVMVWDSGRWIPQGDPHKAYRKGHLIFVLDGKKLSGRWHLVRMRRRPNEKQDAWLLIKSDDQAARGGQDPDVLEEMPLSAASGRSLAEIAAGRGGRRVWQSNHNDGEAEMVKTADKAPAVPTRRSTRAPRRARTSVKKGSAKKGSAKKTSAKKSAAKKGKSARKKRKAAGSDPLPDFVPPALATLRSAPPVESGWLHEVKFDGYRIQARLDHGDVRLLSRNGLDWTAKFPNVAAAVAALPAATALLDGEVVVANPSGVSSFSALQGDLKAGRRDRFVYEVFDLLHRDGSDLARLPLTQRKAALRRLLARAKGNDGPVRSSEALDEDGALVLRHACRMQLEGIVSKRVDAPYVAGRTGTWIKAKCSNLQEFVVIGYAASNVERNAVGALIVGYYENGRLRYGGRVGTGYSRTAARDLWKLLHPLKIDRPPIDPPPQEMLRRDAVWVAPKVVIEANFRDWTADHLVRQAAFKGVREDKPAKEVKREVPAMAARATTATKRSKPPASRRKAAAALNGDSGVRDRGVRDSGVRLTHPDRVYWVDVGVTKQDLADYYQAVWDWMAPHVVGRPLAMLRCPEGTRGQCFFQKHAAAGLDEKALRTVIDPKGRQVIAVDDLTGLLTLVQAGVLEAHVRGAMIDRLEVCDRIVFDLDPGDGVAWPAMVAAAREVRARLGALGLESFVKLTGGKGLHVVLPIEGADWDSAKAFAQALASAMAADAPARYLAKISKSLRKGKIFVDYLRNSLEQTSVAAYSTRARAGAPVSAPVAWSELGRTTAANQYTVRDLPKRLARLKPDPWQDIGRVKQKLPDPARAGG